MGLFINTAINVEMKKSSSPFGELLYWLRRLDLNQRPSGYEPDELPLLHSAISSLELDKYSIVYGVCQAFIQKIGKIFVVQLFLCKISDFWLFFQSWEKNTDFGSVFRRKKVFFYEKPLVLKEKPA